MTQYVIIGSGVAGITAVESIRSQDKQSRIIMIGDEKDRYYSRPGLAYFLTDEIPEKFLYPFDQKQHKSLNYHWVNNRVVNIDLSEHTLELKTGEKVRYDRLLVAVGASANMPKIKGINLEGIIKFDTLRDARRIIKLARKAKSAVVIGGGITALEIVEGLSARGVKTHYFLRGDRYWGKVLDPTESKIVEKRLKHEGVHIHYHTEAEEILEKRGKVAGVLTKDGKKIKSDIVGFAIGIRPRLALAKKTNIETERGILVNEYLETNQPDIFAAGDVAQVHDPMTGQSILDSLWEPARNQGRTAGLNMAGQRTPYKKPAAFNVTRLAGLTTTIIGMVGVGGQDDLYGIARGDSESWRQIPDAIASQSHFDVNRIRLQVGQNTILGAIIMGNQTLSPYLQEIVRDQIDISPIRDQLIQPNAPVADLITNFYLSRRQHA